MYCPVCRNDYPEAWKVCPTDTTTLLKSAQIGKYKIDGLLGVGGMGAVYRATNPDTKGRVAIKVMNASVAGAESARARFQREAASVAALRTSHVVKVYDFGAEADGTLYLVMELMDGHTLRDEITPAPDYMDLARVQMVMNGTLKGLAAAHKAGIVHRDLKPENIFVADTDDGEIPKLLDFGIARVRTGESDLTRTGALMGTASYMATEQVAAGVGEVGSWTDVYAMGAILYEMLAGAPAFDAPTITDVLSRVLRGDVVPLETVRPGLSPGIYDLLRRCLSSEPKTRPQDAEAMRVALADANLVAPNAPIPPPHRTKQQMRAEGVASTANSNPGLDATALPPDSKLPIAKPAAVVGPTLPIDRSSGPAPAEPKNRGWIVAVGLTTLALGGIVVGLIAVMTKSHAPPPPHTVVIDAAVAASPIDAAVLVVVAPPVDAPPADPHAGMVKVASGRYPLGIAKGLVADSLPKRTVTLAHDVWLDATEVTIGQLRAAIPTLPADTQAMTAKDVASLPARYVDWPTADAACKAMGKRLPTEDEWDVAAATTANDLATARLKRLDNDTDLTAASTDCSPDGLCDMLGGVREWTSDAWKGKPGTKVVRGASYRTPPDDKVASIHARMPLATDVRDNEIGFRCAN